MKTEYLVTKEFSMRKYFCIILIGYLMRVAWADVVYTNEPSPKFHPWFLALNEKDVVTAERRFGLTVGDSLDPQIGQVFRFSAMVAAINGNVLLVREQWNGSAESVAYVVNAMGDVLQEFHTTWRGQCTAVCRNDSGYVFAGWSPDSSALWAQGMSATGDSLWNRISPNRDFQYLSAIHSSPDGVVLVACRSDYGGKIVGHVFLNFTGPQSEWREQRIMDVPDLIDAGCFSIVRMPDHSVFLAASVMSKNAVWFSRTDVKGQVLWAKDSVDLGVQKIHSIIGLSNGDLLAAGGSFDSTRRFFIPTLLRLAEDGSVLWKRAYPDQVGNFFRAIAAASDGTFILAGTSFDNSGSERTAVLLRVNAEGKVQNRSLFKAPLASYFSSLLVQPNRSVMLIGGWSKEKWEGKPLRARY